MSSTTNKSCWNLTARTGCRIVAACLLIKTVLHFGKLIDSPIGVTFFTLNSIADVALFLGAQFENQWLVLAWLIEIIFYLVGLPISIFVGLYELDDKSKDTVRSNVLIIAIIFDWTVNALLVRYVFSYWRQLRNLAVDIKPLVEA